VTFQQEVNELMSRIAKAESERDAWQAAGWQERYFEAYCTVEALELLLGQRMREGAAAQADAGDLDCLPR
jgi:hypothetical protein